MNKEYKYLHKTIIFNVVRPTPSLYSRAIQLKSTLNNKDYNHYQSDFTDLTHTNSIPKTLIHPITLPHK